MMYNVSKVRNECVDERMKGIVHGCVLCIGMYVFVHIDRYYIPSTMELLMSVPSE